MANLETKITLSAVDKASPAIKLVGQSLDRLKKSAASISASYGVLSSAAGDFGRKMRNLALVTAAAGAGVYGIVKSYAELGETLNLTSQKTGVSVENLQKLGHAAELDRISADDLRMSLQFLNRNLALARGNSKSPQAEMFRGLGINVNKTKDAYEAFMQISDKFSKSNNTAEKNLFARGLMGRGGVNLIPLLNHGSKAIRELGEEYARLGHIISNEAAEAADNFGDNLQRLGVASKGLVAIFAEQLIPVLNPLVMQFTEWVAANKELVRTNVQVFIAGAVDAFKALAEVFSTVNTILTPLIAAFGGLGNVVKLLAFVYVATLTASFIKLVSAAVMMIPALSGAAAAAWAFAAPLLVLSAPLLGVVAAIGLIGYGLYQLISRFTEFKSAWVQLWSQAPEILNSFVTASFDAIKSKISAMIDWIKSKYESIKNLLGLDGEKIQISASKTAARGTVQNLNSAITSVSIPSANSAGSVAATPAKTSLLTPPASTGQLASAQNSRTKLDVYMKIDSEGKAKNIKAKSSSPLDFAANTGVMV